MINKYISRLTTKRQFSAVLGVTKEEFNKLLPSFSTCLQKKIDSDYQKSLATRRRKLSPGNPELLKTDTDKLIFILYYLKNYPTYDVMGFNFEIGKSTAESYVKMLTPILLDAEEYLKVLPKSIIESPKEFSQLADNKVILVDATERTHYRHKDNELQKKISVESTVITH